MESTAEKIDALRKAIQDHKCDGYLIPRADEFQGEFVAAYAERLKWLTGFTGSAGMAIVLQDKACLLTDGRYLSQAASQIDTGIFDVVNSMEEGASGWLNKVLEQGATIGYDPLLLTPVQLEKIEEKLDGMPVSFMPLETNLIDGLMEDPAEHPKGKIEIFPENIAGRSFKDKKAAIAREIAEQNATAAIITLPDSIAWLLNLRGSDIDYIPSILSYALVYGDNRPIKWIVDEDKLSQDIVLYLDEQVTIHAPDDLETLLDRLAKESREEGKVVLFDKTRSPIWFQNVLEDGEADVKNYKDPCIAPKAIKTPEEIAAIKQAHVLDGISLARFMFWLQGKIDNSEDITELDVSTKLRAIRARHKEFRGPSFPTIAGFGANAAIIHYRATEDTNTAVVKGNLLLIDSGGQYAAGNAYGTTDITRTFAIGQPTDEMKKYFTLALKGHIAVASAVFSKDTIGADIDALARAPLQEHGANFAHGTGHGVGCYLMVHEEATSISPRGKDPFKPGMLISNEPGYYKDGDFGIRIENLVLVQETDGQKLCFETIGYAPIDKTLIDVALLNEAEIEWLDRYHAAVYTLIAPHLEELERTFLKDMTSSLK